MTEFSSYAIKRVDQLISWQTATDNDLGKMSMSLYKGESRIVWEINHGLNMQGVVSLNKRFLQLHKPTIKKVQSLARSCWPSLRLQSWAQLVREADSLLAELIIHFKVKCWLIIHPICSQERNMLQILLHLKTWLCANSSLAFRFASLVLEAERAKRGTCRKKWKATTRHVRFHRVALPSVGTLEPSRVWGDRSQRQGNILKTCNQYLAAVNWRC